MNGQFASIALSNASLKLIVPVHKLAAKSTINCRELSLALRYLGQFLIWLTPILATVIPSVSCWVHLRQKISSHPAAWFREIWIFSLVTELTMFQEATEPEQSELCIVQV